MNPTKLYHDALEHILNNGTWRDDPNRSSVKRLQVPSLSLTFDMENFPLLTTKKMWWKGIVIETLWMLKGDQNIKYLLDNGVNIWNKDAYNFYVKKYKSKFGGLLNSEEEFVNFIKDKENLVKITPQYSVGDIGKMYGYNWRNFYGVDQISNLIAELYENPLSSNLVIFGDSPSFREDQALPCCMPLMQFSVENNNLHLTVNYRSWDYLLGAPWNIAQYGLILHIIAHLTEKHVGTLTFNSNNVHLYSNQIDAAQEQLNRDCFKFDPCHLNIDNIIDLFNPDNYKIEDYQSYPKLENQPEMVAYD